MQEYLHSFLCINCEFLFCAAADNTPPWSQKPFDRALKLGAWIWASVGPGAVGAGGELDQCCWSDTTVMSSDDERIE